MTDVGSDNETEGGAVRTAATWIPASADRIQVSRAIEHPIADVERILRYRPDQLVRLAYGLEASTSSELSVFLVPFPARAWLRVPAVIEFRTPSAEQTGAALSLTWCASRYKQWFPVLEASLSVQPGGSVATLELTGVYRPPLGLVGLLFDHFVGKRIATTTAVGFVDTLAAAIEVILSPS